ncbi:hypothetical protein L3Y34_015994 [Caenorhabditis briggsae]|uniref:Uncharacterized protein n=1 Tax=Caenorhabditis briggsae TaxID=6238 RepID=A0AAE9J0I5_CAEBR|nr:hypothetical protein L3Y34_015994 [Caenorhabditis briggsae]
MLLAEIILFLLASDIVYSEFPIRKLIYEFDIECPDTSRLCLFIEVFEDEVIYEQLLNRYSQCITPQGPLWRMGYLYDSGLFRVKLDPIPIGRKDKDFFTANFQVTHDCTANKEIRCARFHHLFDGGEQTKFKDQQFNFYNYGEPGPCSNRWEGSQLWMDHQDKERISKARHKKKYAQKQIHA